MKIIFVGSHHDRSRILHLGRWSRALLSICVLGLPLGAGVALGYGVGIKQQAGLGEASLAALRQQVAHQVEEIERLRGHSEQRLRAMTLRLAELQARVVRLDALGERMTTLAELDDGEFDFGQQPSLGGPELTLAEGVAIDGDMIDSISQLAELVDSRARQLDLLEQLLSNRKLKEDTTLAGRPVRKGWQSSRFGRRTDPFTGHPAFHGGVDFAGRAGSEIVAVAGGVVSWAGERQAYGNLVDVSHGNGYVTRYAHNKKNLVETGDLVRKGQVIALMGATGRATGPHVHFEVHKHGRVVDPASYIRRASR